MPYFNNDGVKIYYEIEGEGPPVVMIHGFSANLESNWKMVNWVNTLKDKYRLILLDCRGHGKSDKPLDPTQYGAHMTDDIIKLIDYLSIEKANFFGYSMGSRLTLNILFRKQELFKSAILGGFVLQFLSEEERPAAEKRSLQIAEALEAKNTDDIKNPIGLGFRQLAESTGANLGALAAVTKGGFRPQVNEFQTNAQMKEALKRIKVPVMTVVGSDDFIPGDKSLMAQLVPNACHFQIQGKNHLSTVPDHKFKMVVKAFLDYVNYN